jgi:hypothetical protein
LSQFGRHFRCSHADHITGQIHGLRLSGFNTANAKRGDYVLRCSSNLGIAQACKYATRLRFTDAGRPI